MVEKKLSLKMIFIITAIIQVILVIISGTFSKQLVIGFDDGKFVFRHEKVHYNLQDEITEQFQIDEYIQKASIIHNRNVLNPAQFVAQFQSPSNEITQKIKSLFDAEIDDLLRSKNDFSEQDIALIVHDLMRILNSEQLFEPDFEDIIRGNFQGSSAELADLFSSFQAGNDNMSEREKIRLNRIVVDAGISDEILEPQKVEPKIYGSYGLYKLSKSFFGENNAVGAFRLLRMLLLLDIIILLIAFLTKRLLFDRPSKPQLVFEMLYEVFESFVTDTLGKQNAHFTPYILTIFIFVWISNMMGMFPIPGVFEPTRNVNVPLGLGFMAVVFVHVTAIKMKGAWPHLSQFVNPVKNPMFLLDIVGEFSKLVSMSFRLFGNILGGSIILLVISSLVNYIVMPVGLMLFFNLFVGTVQAFVFTMLALTYISVQILEE
jgi:F-type H+-transporting ATPase subunit a